MKAFGTQSPDPPKKGQPIAKVSAKKKQQDKEAKPERDELKQWFTDRIKEMKGKCKECGCKINKHNSAYAIMSVAHILPKRKEQFPSVKTHVDNWIELCPDHHALYDRSWEDAAQMKIWAEVVDRFTTLYPFIAAKEKRHIPEVLLQELNPNVLLATHDSELQTTIIEKA